MRKRKTKRRPFRLRSNRRFWASLITAVILFFLQQQGKPINQNQPMPEEEALEEVDIASVYDGDTFKINLNCSLAVYCEKVPVRVRGVDCPEMKGKTAKEKRLAQQAKAFTKDFLSQPPITLTHCGRDKYFRLLCDVSNAQGEDLAQALIQRGLGYAYDGGEKSNQFK